MEDVTLAEMIFRLALGRRAESEKERERTRRKQRDRTARNRERQKEKRGGPTETGPLSLSQGGLCFSATSDVLRTLPLPNPPPPPRSDAR